MDGCQELIEAAGTLLFLFRLGGMVEWWTLVALVKFLLAVMDILLEQFLKLALVGGGEKSTLFSPLNDKW